MKMLTAIGTKEVAMEELETRSLLEDAILTQHIMYIDDCAAYYAQMAGKNFAIVAMKEHLKHCQRWDHVVVRPYFHKSIPDYVVMAKLADAFFEESECAMQVIPRRCNYVNIEPYTMHLWNLEYVFFELDEAYEIAVRCNYGVIRRTDSCGNEFIAMIREDWPLWSDIVKVKEAYFGEDDDAVLVNRSFYDDVEKHGNKKIVIIWKADTIALPESILV